MATIEFFWDIGSTNTYFAFRDLAGIVARTGAEVVYRPFNLGYVFRHHDYVLAEEPRAKLRYRREDLMRWAEWKGLPFRMPDEFPIKTSRALRGALVMQEFGQQEAYLERLFSAYWERNTNVAEYATILELIADLEIDPERFLARAESDEIKTRLIDSTNDGLARGIFGAPTCLVGEDMFWGKDRMDFVERACAT